MTFVPFDYIDNGILKTSERDLERQGRPSQGTPTPPGYGYLTRHLRTRRLTLGEAVQIADRRVLVLEMRKKHGSAPKIHTCSGPDSRNEQDTGIQGAITNGTPVPPPQVRTTPLAGGAAEQQKTDGRLAVARSGSNNNDPRSGWPNCSSDGLRADAAATLPSPTPTLEGRGQVQRARGPKRGWWR